jgi:hypothetical protein
MNGVIGEFTYVSHFLQSSIAAQMLLHSIYFTEVV